MITFNVNKSGYNEIVITNLKKRNFPGGSKKGARINEMSESSIEFSIKRAKRNLKRIILNQDLQKASFLTLTYADIVNDRRKVFSDFKSFVRKLERKFSINLKYVGVLEFQKRGSLHFHILMFDVPFMFNDEIAKIWSHGFIKINKIKGVKNIISYLQKYISKDMIKNFSKYQKKYFASKGLFRGLRITCDNFDYLGQSVLMYFQKIKNNLEDFFMFNFSFLDGCVGSYYWFFSREFTSLFAFP